MVPNDKRYPGDRFERRQEVITKENDEAREFSKKIGIRVDKDKRIYINECKRLGLKLNCSDCRQNIKWFYINRNEFVGRCHCDKQHTHKEQPLEKFI
jgi:hypothetical protein